MKMAKRDEILLILLIWSHCSFLGGVLRGQSQQVKLRPPVFSLGQEVCGEKACDGLVFGATTATPATLPEPLFSFIMTDLKRGQRGRNTGQKWVWNEALTLLRENVLKNNYKCLGIGGFCGRLCCSRTLFSQHSLIWNPAIFTPCPTVSI